MSKNKGLIFIFLLGVVILLQSCTTGKQYVTVPYFKDLPDSARAVIANRVYTPLLIQPNDQLSISVQSDDALSSEMLSKLSSSQINVPMLNNPLGQMGQTAASPLGGYMVDMSGNILISNIGKVKVAGLTTGQARDLLAFKIDSFGVKNPAVNVQFANLKITVLGEVNRPGTYVLTNEKNTIFDALGQAGDLSIYGKRTNLVLVRDSAGHSVYTRFSLNSIDIANKDFYYLRPNDMIYVEPNLAKAKSANVDNATLQYYGLAASIASLLVVIVTQLKN